MNFKQGLIKLQIKSLEKRIYIGIKFEVLCVLIVPRQITCRSLAKSLLINLVEDGLEYMIYTWLCRHINEFALTVFAIQHLKNMTIFYKSSLTQYSICTSLPCTNFHIIIVVKYSQRVFTHFKVEYLRNFVHQWTT